MSLYFNINHESNTELGMQFAGGGAIVSSDNLNHLDISEKPVKSAFNGFFSYSYNSSFADPTMDSNMWTPSNSEIIRVDHPLVARHCLNESSFRSRYARVVQEILARIASYSMENVPMMSCYSSRFEKPAAEPNKTELLTLLRAIDDQYKQCVDAIHSVISTFHAVTESDPQRHRSFALRTVSCLYKNLRQRISAQIMSIGAKTSTPWKRKEVKLWRPERGLPERSVAVLRAWMFQNFLHPYPKDAEKHLLAVKSGISRNQVSNWFINARVRLWKPMIEEMYSEMSKRKARDMREDGSNKVSRKSDKSNVRHDLNRK